KCAEPGQAVISARLVSCCLANKGPRLGFEFDRYPDFPPREAFPFPCVCIHCIWSTIAAPALPCSTKVGVLVTEVAQVQAMKCSPATHHYARQACYLAHWCQSVLRSVERSVLLLSRGCLPKR